RDLAEESFALARSEPELGLKTFSRSPDPMELWLAFVFDLAADPSWPGRPLLSTVTDPHRFPGYLPSCPEDVPRFDRVEFSRRWLSDVFAASLTAIESITRELSAGTSSADEGWLIGSRRQLNKSLGVRATYSRYLEREVRLGHLELEK